MNEKELALYYSEKYAVTQTKKDISKLKALDKKVTLPPFVFAMCFGVIGSLVFGFGMCLAMKVIFDLFIHGVIIGILGIFMVSINYPIYKKMLNRRKNKYAKQILELSESILNA